MVRGSRLKRAGNGKFMTFDTVIAELRTAKYGLSRDDQKAVNALVWIDDNLK